jgi:hypothetical protein
LEETNWSGAGNSILKKNNIPNTSLRKTRGIKRGVTIEEPEAAAVVLVTDVITSLETSGTADFANAAPLVQTLPGRSLFQNVKFCSRWIRKCY